MTKTITKLLLNGQTYQIKEYEGWQPGANTIAYYPLESDLNDALGNYNGTEAGTTITYGTIGGSVVDAAFLSYSRVTTSLTTLPNTINMWIYKLSTGDQNPADWKQIIGFNNGDGGGAICFRGTDLSTNNAQMYIQVGNAIGMSYRPSHTLSDMWLNICITTDGTTRKLYVNGVEQISDSGDFGTAEMGMWFGTAPYNVMPSDYCFYGYMSNIILESSTWSAQEISDYYNLTKGDYGII